MDHMSRVLRAGLFVMIALAIGFPAVAGEIVAFHAGPGGITIRPLVPFEFGTLTVGTPDGLVFKQDLSPGSGVAFNPLSQPGYQAPDGTYIWQVVLGQPSTVHPRLRAAARANRGGGDPDIEAAARAATERATMIQSGAFTIENGGIVPSDLAEPGAGPKGAATRRPALEAFRQADWSLDDRSVQPVDQVIPDDLIVQGSECVGLDCVNNENFGFDTIRLKENNTRIHFDDTSTSAGFPANDWRIIANDSASGGSSKFSIEDSTGSKTPFTITAGASTNSIFVDSTGRVGLRTSTPVLDLHVNTSNTPAIRLEQNNSGGFTAQTWDIGANEANFFVRDVTGGSKLSFRIRPGAPTSSLDISADGDVGIATASPDNRLHVLTDVNADGIKLDGTSNPNLMLANNDTVRARIGLPTAAAQYSNDSLANDLVIRTEAVAQRILFNVNGGTGASAMAVNNGSVGIGTAVPARQLHTTSTVRFAGLPSCTNGIVTNASGDLACAASSQAFKHVTGDLSPQVALANVMALRPQTGAFKDTPEVPEHWFIAEQAATVDPALVGLHDGKPFTVKTTNVVADLVAVVQQQQRQIQEQQRFIEEQRSRLEALERATARPRNLGD